jgi:hypothetical protein
MQLSTLLDRFAEPETLKMAKLGRELRAKGIDVILIPLSISKMLLSKPSMITGATTPLLLVLQT